MLADPQVSPGPTRASIGDAGVAILICTKDGAAYLGQQLESIAAQTHTNWVLVASDDGSIDATKEILKRFAATQHQTTIIRNGPRKGVCANFLSLAADPTITADYFAFSDQDDIWNRDKLKRALTSLGAVPNDVPAVYCSRTEIMSIDGRSLGFSPLFARPPAFRNALVQSLGGGNTMVFNRAAKKMLEMAGIVQVVLHDWWVYQLVSAAGGRIYYDPQPVLKYRQHPENIIGSNIGWDARLLRLRMMLSGRFREWNEINISALRHLPAHLITPENRETLELFAKARLTTSLLKRLHYLKGSGVYRQTILGDIGLFVAAILKRF